jgi:hypothetical protein
LIGAFLNLCTTAPTAFYRFPIHFSAVNLPVGVVFADNNRMSTRREFGFILHQLLGDFIGIVFRMRVVKAFTDTPIGDDAMISKIEPIERHGGETARSAAGSTQILAR